jgi:phage terminase large subunit GpA-like protein
MFTTIDTMAADYAKAQAALKLGKHTTWRNFINNQLGQFWEVRDRETSAEVLDGHIIKGETAYRMRQVPPGVQLITMGIDVQADHVWVLTKGYGYQNQQWLIHAGRLETGHTGRQANWEIVDAYIRSEWLSQVDNSVKFYAKKVNIDCRYQRAERDEESTVIYDFCIAIPHREGFINPVMGFSRKRMKEMSIRGIHPLAGSTLTRYNINVDLYKDRAWETLHNPEATPGPKYMHLPIDLPGDIKRQLCSEEQILVDGVPLWKVKDGHTDNHCWDCNIYADVAAEIAGAFSLRNIDPVKTRLQVREKQQRLAEKRNRSRDDFQEGNPDIV